MKRVALTGVLGCTLLLQPILGAQNKETGMPKVGDLAPDFLLKYADSSGMHDVTLNQYRGKKQVVLAFYIFAFTGG